MNKVNLNDASVEDLMSIEGIGQVAARKIVDYRNKKGNISNFDELRNIGDIDDGMVEKIRRGSVI